MCLFDLLLGIEHSALKELELDFNSIPKGALSVIHIEELIRFIDNVEIVDELLADCGLHLSTFFVCHFLILFSFLYFFRHLLFHSSLLSTNLIHVITIFRLPHFVECIEIAKEAFERSECSSFRLILFLLFFAFWLRLFFLRFLFALSLLILRFTECVFKLSSC